MARGIPLRDPSVREQRMEPYPLMRKERLPRPAGEIGLPLYRRGRSPEPIVLSGVRREENISRDEIYLEFGVGARAALDEL